MQLGCFDSMPPRPPSFLNYCSNIASNSFPTRLFFSCWQFYTWAARKDITLPFQSKPCNHWYFKPILWSFFQASRGLIGRLWNLSIFTFWPIPHSLFCSSTGLHEMSQHTWFVPPAASLPGEFFPRECQMAWSFFELRSLLIYQILQKILMLAKMESRRRGRQKMRWLDGITDSMNMFEQTQGARDGQGSLGGLQPLRSQRVTWLSHWTELNSNITSCEKLFLTTQPKVCWPLFYLALCPPLPRFYS